MTSLTVPERRSDHPPDATTPFPPVADRSRLSDPGTDPQTIRVQTRIAYRTGARITHEELSPTQAQAVAAVTGRGALELIVGSAGTGKTTTLGFAVAHLEAQGRPAFGVAPTAAAAEVLATETGITARSVHPALSTTCPPRPP